MKRNSGRWNNAGFNIIELMVAVAVVGIVTAIALPSYNNMLKNNCLTTSTNTLITSLQIARSEAAKRKQNITVTAKGSNWMNGWTVTDTSANILNDVDLNCSSTTITENGARTTIVYRSTGFIDSPAQFDICDDRTGEEGRQLSINMTGRPNTNRNYICS